MRPFPVHAPRPALAALGGVAAVLVGLALFGAMVAGPLGEAAAVSARVVTLAATLSIGFALPLAVALARWRGRARPLVEAALMAPLVLPPTVTGWLIAVVAGRHGVVGRALEAMGGSPLTFSWVGAGVAAAVVSYPLLLRTARPAIGGVDPRFGQVARTLGASPLQVLLRVTLPLAAPGITAGVALSMGRALGEFGATLMVAGSIPGATRTLPLAVYAAFASGRDAIAAGASLLLVAMAVVLLGAAALAEREAP